MESNEKNTKNLVYAIIGVITLVVTVIGATFAYYTSTDTVDNAFTGNMATISFDLKVAKVSDVDDVKGGLIPMTNSMIQKAVNNISTNGICVDDNNNAVCQIYKITVINSSSASMFVDGYVTLTGGSGEPTDRTTSPTTMRWVQVFCTEDTDGDLASCTTAGTSTARQTNTSGFTWTALGSVTDSQHDTAEIKDTFSGTGGVTGTATISENSYPVINTNYIRVSEHTADATYTQTADVTSALVYNQYLAANDGDAKNNEGGDSSDSDKTTADNQSYADSQVLYIAVWLSENGLDQTVGSTATDAAGNRNGFFSGTVKFVSAQGSEVTSRFNGYTAVTPDTKQPAS